MTIPTLNAFCRRYDLIFVEMGRVNGSEVYWFIDFQHERRYYTAEEIKEKVCDPLPA
jgi:hypothetical protein